MLLHSQESVFHVHKMFIAVFDWPGVRVPLDSETMRTMESNDFCFRQRWGVQIVFMSEKSLSTQAVELGMMALKRIT
jgi:hypothetical protein